jgi:hypothetical protein
MTLNLFMLLCEGKSIYWLSISLPKIYFCGWNFEGPILFYFKLNRKNLQNQTLNAQNINPKISKTKP